MKSFISFCSFNSFLFNVPYLFLLKTSGNQKFSDVFRGGSKRQYWEEIGQKSVVKILEITPLNAQENGIFFWYLCPIYELNILIMDCYPNIPIFSPYKGIHWLEDIVFSCICNSVEILPNFCSKNKMLLSHDSWYQDHVIH